MDENLREGLAVPLRVQIEERKRLGERVKEIKAQRSIPEQYKNLLDDRKCREAEFRFGKITKRTVLYRGENTTDGEVVYQNVEEFLCAE